jgi:hypothetical protein
MVKNKKGSKKGVSKKSRKTNRMETDLRFSLHRGENTAISNVMIDFLQDNPGSTLMKIHNYTKNNFPHTRATVGNILKKLVEENTLKDVSENSVPHLEVIDTSEFMIQNDSYVFKDQICCNNLSANTSLRDKDMIKRHSDSRKNGMVDMILKLGLISYYSCLSSFERGTSPKLKEKENEELQKIWLRNAMSLENNLNDGRPSTHLLVQIGKNIDEDKRIAWENSDTEDDESFEEITMHEQIEEAKKLKMVFSKMFPEWYESFQSDQKVTENMKNGLREVCINHPEYLLK